VDVKAPAYKKFGMTDNHSLDAVLKSVRQRLTTASPPSSGAIDTLSDASIRTSYEAIRQQVEADKLVGPACRSW